MNTRTREPDWSITQEAQLRESTKPQKIPMDSYDAYLQHYIESIQDTIQASSDVQEIDHAFHQLWNTHLDTSIFVDAVNIVRAQYPEHAYFRAIPDDPKNTPFWHSLKILIDHPQWQHEDKPWSLEVLQAYANFNAINAQRHIRMHLHAYAKDPASRAWIRAFMTPGFIEYTPDTKENRYIRQYYAMPFLALRRALWQKKGFTSSKKPEMYMSRLSRYWLDVDIEELSQPTRSLIALSQCQVPWTALQQIFPEETNDPLLKEYCTLILPAVRQQYENLDMFSIVEGLSHLPPTHIALRNYALANASFWEDYAKKIPGPMDRIWCQHPQMYQHMLAHNIVFEHAILSWLHIIQSFDSTVLLEHMLQHPFSNLPEMQWIWDAEYMTEEAWCAKTISALAPYQPQYHWDGQQVWHALQIQKSMDLPQKLIGLEIEFGKGALDLDEAQSPK